MSIPEEYRTGVVLVDMSDFSYEEAAEIVSCPVGTIRAGYRAGEAWEQLRPYFQGERGVRRKNDL